MAAITARGARLAKAGEFTQRAFLNGKLDLAQAESVLATLSPRPEHFKLTELVLGNIPDRGWPVGMAIKAGHKELGQAIETAGRVQRQRLLPETQKAVAAAAPVGGQAMLPI